MTGIALSPSNLEVKSRHAGIDLLRLSAFIAVVLIHVTSDTNRYDLSLTDVVNQLGRFAVPFFFTTSGYLLGTRIAERPWSYVGPVVLKIGFAYLFWTTAYNLPYVLTHRMTVEIAVRILIAGGPYGYHLWFLPSLISGLCAFKLLSKCNNWRISLGVGCVFYLIALLIGSYGRMISIPSGGTLIARFLPMSSLLFITAGAWLSTRPKPRLSTGVALAVGGAMLSLVEAATLARYHVAPFQSDDILVGTVPYGVGMFCISLSLSDRLQVGRVLRQLAVLSLGLYVVHLAFVYLFDALVGPASFSGQMLVAGLTVMATALIVYPLGATRYTSWLVK